MRQCTTPEHLCGRRDKANSVYSHNDGHSCTIRLLFNSRPTCEPQSVGYPTPVRGRSRITVSQ
eukprot:11381237-Karenia_brevis.AAC.1